MNSVPPVYLDHNASAPLTAAARAAICAALDAGPGNASSPHAAGRRLRRLLGDARERVAALVGAAASEVVFTSGATESNALALQGALAAAPPGRDALVTTDAEHPSIAATAARLEREGTRVRRAGVNAFGRVTADEVVQLAAADAAIVSVVHAQPVTGALQPVAVIARRIDAPLHVDAAQSAGRVAVDVGAIGCALLSLSSHKLGGPQGVGALIVREGAAWRNPFTDGSQERGRRAGTEAVALAAGFGAAAEEVAARIDAFAHDAAAALAPLRRLIEADATAACWSPAIDALPNTLLVAFERCPGDALLAALDARGICVSTGTACASGARTPAAVLVAGGRRNEDAARAVRVSVGRGTRPEHVEALCRAFRDVVPRVRAAQATV